MPSAPGPVATQAAVVAAAVVMLVDGQAHVVPLAAAGGRHLPVVVVAVTRPWAACLLWMTRLPRHHRLPPRPRPRLRMHRLLLHAPAVAAAAAVRYRHWAAAAAAVDCRH